MMKAVVNKTSNFRCLVLNSVYFSPTIACIKPFQSWVKSNYCYRAKIRTLEILAGSSNGKSKSGKTHPNISHSIQETGALLEPHRSLRYKASNINETLKCKSELHLLGSKRSKFQKKFGIGFGVVVTGIAMIFTHFIACVCVIYTTAGGAGVVSSRRRRTSTVAGNALAWRWRITTRMGNNVTSTRRHRRRRRHFGCYNIPVASRGDVIGETC
jgi:hypothetical protein